MIPSEMYESLNIFFLEVTRWNVDNILESSPHSFFAQVKNNSHLFRGITERTMPTDEARAFLECGMMLERADKTARILDVKYHILLGDAEIGGTLDQHQWIAVLKSVGSVHDTGEQIGNQPNGAPVHYGTQCCAGEHVYDTQYTGFDPGQRMARAEAGNCFFH